MNGAARIERERPSKICSDQIFGPKDLTIFRRFAEVDVAFLIFDKTRQDSNNVAKRKRKSTVVSHCQIIIKEKTICVHCVDRPIV